MVSGLFVSMTLTLFWHEYLLLRNERSVLITWYHFWLVWVGRVMGSWVCASQGPFLGVAAPKVIVSDARGNEDPTLWRGLFRWPTRAVSATDKATGRAASRAIWGAECVTLCQTAGKQLIITWPSKDDRRDGAAVAAVPRCFTIPHYDAESFTRADQHLPAGLQVVQSSGPLNLCSTAKSSNECWQDCNVRFMMYSVKGHVISLRGTSEHLPKILPTFAILMKSHTVNYSLLEHFGM